MGRSLCFAVLFLAAASAILPAQSPATAESPTTEGTAIHAGMIAGEWLVTINLGEIDGVALRDTFDLYLKECHIGSMRIDTVQPHEAVGFSTPLDVRDVIHQGIDGATAIKRPTPSTTPASSPPS